VETIPSSVAPDLNLVEGVELRAVRPRTPAATAKLHAATGSKIVDGDSYSTGGDVITAIDGQKVTTSEGLQRAIDAKRPGDTISLEFWRTGESHTIDVKLATRPS